MNNVNDAAIQSITRQSGAMRAVYCTLGCDKPTLQARPETPYVEKERQKEGTDEPGPFALVNKLNGIDLAPLRRLTVEVINEPQLAAPAATDRGAR